MARTMAKIPEKREERKLQRNIGRKDKARLAYAS